MKDDKIFRLQVTLKIASEDEKQFINLHVKQTTLHAFIFKCLLNHHRKDIDCKVTMKLHYILDYFSSIKELAFYEIPVSITSTSYVEWFRVLG